MASELWKSLDAMLEQEANAGLLDSHNPLSPSFSVIAECQICQTYGIDAVEVLLGVMMRQIVACCEAKLLNVKHTETVSRCRKALLLPKQQDC